MSNRLLNLLERYYVYLHLCLLSLSSASSWLILIILECFRISLQNFTFDYNMTRIRGTLHGNGCTCMIISRSILPGMRNVVGKFIEKIKTHILCSITFLFFFGNRVVCEMMWENMVDPDIGACILHAEYLRLQTHTQNVKHLLLFHSRNGYANAPQYYVYTYIVCLVHNWRRDESVSWGDP